MLKFLILSPAPMWVSDEPWYRSAITAKNVQTKFERTMERVYDMAYSLIQAQFLHRMTYNIIFIIWIYPSSWMDVELWNIDLDVDLDVHLDVDSNQRPNLRPWT